MYVKKRGGGRAEPKTKTLSPSTPHTKPGACFLMAGGQEHTRACTAQQGAKPSSQKRVQKVTSCPRNFRCKDYGCLPPTAGPRSASRGFHSWCASLQYPSARSAAAKLGQTTTSACCSTAIANVLMCKRHDLGGQRSQWWVYMLFRAVDEPVWRGVGHSPSLHTAASIAANPQAPKEG